MMPASREAKPFIRWLYDATIEDVHRVVILRPPLAGLARLRASRTCPALAAVFVRRRCECIDLTNAVLMRCTLPAR